MYKLPRNTSHGKLVVLVVLGLIQIQQQAPRDSLSRMVDKCFNAMHL